MKEQSIKRFAVEQHNQAYEQSKQKEVLAAELPPGVLIKPINEVSLSEIQRLVDVFKGDL